MRYFVSTITAYVVKCLLSLLLKTCRIRITGIENLERSARNSPCILALWHNRIALVAHVLSKYTSKITYAAFISQSRDGEILAAFTKSYSRGSAIRVAHNKRGCALKALIDHLKRRDDVILMTPDGPRGPCYEIKPGIIAAAQETQAKIIPFSWAASACWKLKSWDQFMIPKPFSTIEASFGAPLTLSKEAPVEVEIELLHTQLAQ